MILNTTKAETDLLPNLRKAAILLVALGEGTSAQLMQQLNEEEVQKAITVIIEKRDSPAHRLDQVTIR